MFSIRIPGWLRLILLPLTRFDFRIGCLVLQCPLIVFLLLIPLTVLITALIWPGLVPIGLFQFWGWWGSPLDIAVLFWPMLVIGLLLTLINIPGIRNRADIVLVNARNWLFLWLQAGPMEELVYRWLFFYGTIVCLPILNFATFGLLQWFYSTVLGPIADLLTLHQLHDYLFNSQYGWVVGMAIISTNGGFRDEHAYQGIIGWIWAWFGGMFLFLIMFRHGLFAAMLVHTFYNLCILALIWLVARLHMTPEEAQELVQAKLQAQQEALQAWLAGDFPPGTVVDQAPPYSSPAGTASLRRRFRGLRRDQQGGTDEKIP